MYAVIETGSKQYKVEKGKTIDIEILGKKPEDEISFDKVLFVHDDKDIKVGNPYIKGAKVIGKLLSNAKAEKVIAFKYKSKSNYRRTKGHRQHFSRIKIEEIRS